MGLKKNYTALIPYKHSNPHGTICSMRPILLDGLSRKTCKFLSLFDPYFSKMIFINALALHPNAIVVVVVITSMIFVVAVFLNEVSIADAVLPISGDNLVTYFLH